ncbi:MAG: RNA polymerase sporulation sigma factor SigK [Peptococcaceae bacterium]
MSFELIGNLATSFIRTLLLLISYLTNDSFPQPLSEEAEQKYLEELLQGNHEARNILIAHNLRLVAYVTKKYESTNEDKEDLISIGIFGLIKGIDTFKPDKGVKLSTYAAKCIDNEILMHLRAIKKTKGDVSLSEPIGTDKEGNEITYGDILGTEKDIVANEVENAIDYEILLKNTKVLNKTEKIVIATRFGLINGIRKTQKEVAKILGISRSYISRIEKKAIEKLKKEVTSSK